MPGDLIKPSTGPNQERWKRVRHVVLDMDGTIYLGGRLFPETLPFLATLEELGIGWDFLTNNNSKSRADYVDSLELMGVVVEAEQVVMSTDACVATLRRDYPKVRRIFVLGTSGMKKDIEGAGFEVVSEDECDAVVVGYDTSLNYESLCRAAYWVGREKPYLATHPDLVCPTEMKIILPDCGAICALLESATGRKPDQISGKPNPAILEAVMNRRGLAVGEVVMVGDRIYTDMRMAREAGVLAALTLTGEATREELIDPASSPDLIINDLGELEALLRASRSISL